jgi:CRISPR/Cas system-associated exonuclease Cas4 (RecB family)
VEAKNSAWRDGRIAAECIGDANQISAFDGLVSAAGTDVDPTGNGSQVVSASGLEDFAACPRRYFFSRALNVYPPDELQLDINQWLDPMKLGSLAHVVFEKFLRQLTEQRLTPEFARDQRTISGLLRHELQIAANEVPVLNQDAKLRQIQDLEKTCEIFLREEEKYCREFNVRPYVMEATIGTERQSATPLDTAEPVVITLPDRRQFRARGIIDRVDQFHGTGSNLFAIWDYKTGSDWGYDQADATAGGRKLQPYLYATILRHRLVEVVGTGAEVRQFGYFFPSPKTDGRRMIWSMSELQATEVTLGTIFDLIHDGCFIATTDPADCEYCDYREICGDPKTTTANVQAKLQALNLPILTKYQSLRST